MTNRLFGDWDKLRHVLEKLKDNRYQYEEVVESMGRQIADRIRNLIESQSIHLEPLVEDYRSSKVSEGYGDSILIRTGAFIDSIEVTDIVSSGDNVSVFIGIKDGTTTTGISMKELAHYLEYGTENMVGRFPIHRTWEQMRKDIKKEVADRIKAEIRSDLR